MVNDYKKEWLAKSAIDYFAPFLSLWLATNSWYRTHYSELISSGDRKFIDKIKEDVTQRNHLYTNFASCILQVNNIGTDLRIDIELLHYALNRANLQPRDIGACSFSRAVIDFKKKIETDLIIKPDIKVSGSVRKSHASLVLKLDRIYITSNIPIFFAGLFEIIYQVRNMLVHGALNPSKDEHLVVKHCYRILWAIMPK